MLKKYSVRFSLNLAEFSYRKRKHPNAMRYIFAIILMLPLLAVSQVPRKMMPRSVNIPNRHNFAPSFSVDGNIMIYLSTYSGSGEPELKITYKAADNTWETPETVDEVNKFLDINFAGGYCISADGKTIYFTSKRGQGIGEYDILYTEKQGGYWTPAKNLGKPINSIGNDGAPSITPDGQYMYFMRCRKMSRYEAEGCEIWVSKRRNQQIWEEPVKLPQRINTGDEQFPKIFPDNSTLMFSSRRPGGKGGLDFYLSKTVDGYWGEPQAMDFINSDKDEMYAAKTAKDDEVYFSTVYREKESIIVSKLPEEFQGEKVIIMDGTVVDGATEEPMKAFIQVYDAYKQERIIYGRSEEYEGKFSMVFPVGDAYDFSVQPLDKGYVYNSDLYFAEEMTRSKKAQETFRLSKIEDGLTVKTNNIRFAERTAEIEQFSNLELRRIIKLLKDNPEYNIELGVHMNKIVEDSTQSDIDLTELRVDTIVTYEYPEPVLASSDSVITATPRFVDEEEEEDGFVSMDDDESDFVSMDGKQKQDTTALDTKLDSLNQVKPEPVEVTQLVYTYHNNRTPRQAEALMAYFEKQGVPLSRITAVGYGDQFNLVSPESEGSEKVNTRVEIRFLER